jgi:hypothetical protein
MARDRLAPMIGKAGELRVRSELMLRDIIAGHFDVDTGTDVVLENGIKIGVKTSLKPIYSKKDYSYRYTFSIRVPQVRNIGDGLYRKKYMKKDYIGFVDYWIFWCVEDNFFYIVPNKEVGQKVSFCIPTPDAERKYISHKEHESVSKYEKYKNNWEQLK